MTRYILWLVVWLVPTWAAATVWAEVAAAPSTAAVREQPAFFTWLLAVAILVALYFVHDAVQTHKKDSEKQWEKLDDHQNRITDVEKDVLVVKTEHRKNHPLVAVIGLLALFAGCGAPCHATECETGLFHPVYGVFAHEGGYQNSEHDGGNWSGGKVGVGHLCGGTKFGQSCASNPGVDIKNLTKTGAAQLYEKKECRTVRIADLKGQRVPTLYLDLAVNMGDGTAVKLFHRLRNRLNGTDEPDVPITTVMSDDDVRWFNEYTKDFHQRREFLFGLSLVGIDHYTDIVEVNPKQARWLLGWIMRVNPLND